MKTQHLDVLYSVRMRAAKSGRHVSGAERIVPERDIATVAAGLVSRAGGRHDSPDSIVVTIERISMEQIRLLPSLDVATVNADDPDSSRRAAIRILRQAGVSKQAAMHAIDALSRGPAPSGGNMRGAMIMDADTGTRLEPDQERGVRASKFDWAWDSEAELDRLLRSAGLIHFRTREALALATKVAHGPGVCAELCWSDDLDYSAGYVASLFTGYVRFPLMKPQGWEYGGRAFFVKTRDLDLHALIRYLDDEPVLITAPAHLRAFSCPDEYFQAVSMNRVIHDMGDEAGETG